MPTLQMFELLATVLEWPLPYGPAALRPRTPPTTIPLDPGGVGLLGPGQRDESRMNRELKQDAVPAKQMM